MDTGKIVNVAVGMVMERCRINQDEAFELLRQKARSERRKVREIAADMIHAGGTQSACPNPIFNMILMYQESVREVDYLF